MSMTYSDIRSLFYETIGDDESNPTWFTYDQVAVFANAALRQLSRSCKVIRKKTTIAPSAGVGEYDLPDDCHEVYRVLYDGIRIAAITQSRLDADDSYWRDRTGKPYLYYMDRTNKKIGLYPAPSSDVALASFDSEYGVAVPTSGTASSEYGLLVDPSFAEPLDSASEYGLYSAISGNALEVFYWALPEDVDLTKEPDIPGWAVHYVLYAMLADAYNVGMPEPDYQIASLYAEMARDLAVRVKVRSSLVVNKVWRRLGPHAGRKIDKVMLRYPSVIGDTS